jgi:pyridoxine kinase
LHARDDPRKDESLKGTIFYRHIASMDLDAYRERITARNDENYVREALRRLADLGCKTPVITGVHYDDKLQGAAAYDSENDRFYFSFGKNVNSRFHGTGDIFSSVFSGACALGMDVQQCLDISVKFTLDCIEATIPHMEETWYGSCFELCLGKLIGYVKEQK